MEKVLVIAGPTAVGKTALSIKLAKRWNGEVINGDSMQVYRKLNIGTAKVTKEEQQGVVHHLIDICDPQEEYTVSDFQSDARQKIAEVTRRGHLPIVVGGTGLYIQALLYNFQLGSSVEVPKEKRNELEIFADDNGNEALWQRLYKQDPKTAKSIHPNNRQRVIRALEVVEYTGQTFQQKDAIQSLYDAKIIALNTERELLYNRINQRVDMMMDAGLLDEARFVHSLGNVQSARGIGYKEFKPYFEGKSTLEESIEKVKQDSRRYAKRQLTWFRNRMSCDWYDLIQDDLSYNQLENEIIQWLGGD